MTLYAGQTRTDVIRFESEEGKMLFDERTRTEASEVLTTRELSSELHERLIRMYKDGSYQAKYFLGKYIIEDIIEYPVPFEQAPNSLDQTVDELRQRGVQDPYGAIEQE